MNYKQTIEYLFTQLPVYQRTGNAKYKIDLDNTIKLCNILDNPQIILNLYTLQEQMEKVLQHIQ